MRRDNLVLVEGREIVVDPPFADEGGPFVALAGRHQGLAEPDHSGPRMRRAISVPGDDVSRIDIRRHGPFCADRQRIVTRPVRMFVQKRIDRLEFGAARLLQHVTPFDDEPSYGITRLRREQTGAVPIATRSGKGLLQKRAFARVRIGRGNCRFGDGYRYPILYGRHRIRPGRHNFRRRRPIWYGRHHTHPRHAGGIEHRIGLGRCNFGRRRLSGFFLRLLAHRGGWHTQRNHEDSREKSTACRLEFAAQDNLRLVTHNRTRRSS